MDAQAEVLAQVRQSFGSLPLLRSPYRSTEPVGTDEVREVAEELYDGADPVAAPGGPGPFRVRRTRRGAVLHLALPGVASEAVDLARNGDELVLTVASYRRLLTLPQALARLRVAGARVERGELQVRFARLDPDEGIEPGPEGRPPTDTEDQ